MVTAAYESKFVRRVRQEIADQDLSIRGLARKMEPGNLDRARRNLHRWLDGGITPSRSSRRQVAEALGLDEHALDDDDEESHPVFSIDDFAGAIYELMVSRRKATA